MPSYASVDLDAWYQSLRTDPYVFAKLCLYPIGSCFGGHSAVAKSLPVAKLPRTTFSLERCHFSASCGLWKNNGLTSLCIEDVKWPLEHVIVEVKYQAIRLMFLGIA